MLRAFQNVLHISVVAFAVCLYALGVHRRALAEVQRAGLESDVVRRSAHFAAQCVDFKHQVPLCRAADGGVAGHVGDRLQGHGKKNGVHAETCGGKRRLNAGVTRADDNDFCVMIHNSCRYVMRNARVLLSGMCG